MESSFDLSLLWSLLDYNSSSPLIFHSGLFLFLFTGVIGVFYLLRRYPDQRVLFLLAFNTYFYYKSSGFYFLLLWAVILLNYFIAPILQRQKRQRFKKQLLFLSLFLHLSILIYFKYTNFFAQLLAEITAHPFQPLAIFLPIGISFFIFQSLSYIIDVYRAKIAPVDSWKDYAFYISFFPVILSGPILRAGDFIPQIRQNTWVTKEMFSKGLFLICCGLFKKAVISDYIGLNFVDRIFDDPALYSGFENLMAVYGYTLQIYCDFSGYSDMAIGVALWMGLKIPDNFISPYKSASMTEFWRRWHISLSSWLKDYLYISLGGNRKGKIRTYFNLFLTMLLGGLWHGAGLNFVIWGAYHGICLAIEKGITGRYSTVRLIGSEIPSWGHRIVRTLLTFHLVALGWIFFRSSDVVVGFQVIEQIFGQFKWSVIPQFFEGYYWVSLLMGIGFFFHFVPLALENKIQNRWFSTPIWIQALLLIGIIWLIFQVQSSDVQPFIYFQF